MDTPTRTALADHLAASREALTLVQHVPAEASLPLLEEAFHNLEAAIDTLKQWRRSAAEAQAPSHPPRWIGLDMARPGSEATATWHTPADRQLAELVGAARGDSRQTL